MVEVEEKTTFFPLFIYLLDIVKVNFSVIILNSGFRTPDSGFRTPDSGFRIPDSGFRIPDSGFRFPDSGFRIPVSGFLVLGLPIKWRLSNCHVFLASHVFYSYSLWLKLKRKRHFSLYLCIVSRGEWLGSAARLY